MLTICTDNRIEHERQLLALLINHNEMFDLLQIRPNYLKLEEHKIILEYITKSYQTYRIINFEFIQKQSDKDKKKFDFNIYLDIMLNTFCYSSKESMKIQMQLNQESIIEFLKQDIVKDLTTKLNEKKIDYATYSSKLKELDAIKLNKSNNLSMKTIKDIATNEEDKHEIYIKSKIGLFDNAVKGFALTQLSIWSGGNASAKSTFLNQIAIESIEQGYNVAIYSGELIDKRLLNWICLQCAGKTNLCYNKEKEYYYVPTDKKTKILEWLNNKLFIYDNNCGNKAKEIISSIEDCVEKNNVKVVILDNLMSMDLNNYGDNKYDVQSAFVKDLSALAKKLNVHIHFVCHPRKATNFLRKVDISGSADLTNTADNVFIMHRVNNDFKIRSEEMFKEKFNKELYNYTNIIEICKNRDFGVEDYFVGMYFEKESKRLLNTENEVKKYLWEK